MKKVILIIGVIVTGLLVVGIIIGNLFDDKKGLVHVISVTPSSGSTLAVDTEIKVTAAYLFWESSPKIDFYAGLYFKSIGAWRYTAKKVKLPALAGLVTFKTTLADVMCGLEPIVRESNSESEIAKKLFEKYHRRGMIDRFSSEVSRLQGCKYGKIKYPFELVVQTYYQFKKVSHSAYVVDKSDVSVFEVEE